VDRQEIHEKIEQSADVLAAVAAASAGAATNTTVSPGPDTEALPAPVVVNADSAAPPATPPSLPVGRLNKYRLPRKPR
jgi:hypothetical protein